MHCTWFRAQPIAVQENICLATGLRVCAPSIWSAEFFFAMFMAPFATAMAPFFNVFKLGKPGKLLAFLRPSLFPETASAMVCARNFVLDLTSKKASSPPFNSGVKNRPGTV